MLRVKLVIVEWLNVDKPATRHGERRHVRGIRRSDRKKSGKKDENVEEKKIMDK